MKKRIVAVLLSGMMAVCALAGCGSDSKEASSDKKEGKDGGTTISIMASQDWVYDAEMELGKQFEGRDRDQG